MDLRFKRDICCCFVDVDLRIVSGCRLVDRCQWMHTCGSMSVDADLWIGVGGCKLVPDRCEWM